MEKTALAQGTVHTVPNDLQKALQSSTPARMAWEGLTPLARNEWICWVTFVKKVETRQEHVERVIAQLKEGKRRPCCWAGCPHRPDRSPRFLVRQRKTKG